LHLGPVLASLAKNVLGRDHAGTDDALAVVDVVDEAVERLTRWRRLASQPLPIPPQG